MSDGASRNGGPPTVSSAHSDDQSIDALEIMVPCDGDKWCAGGALLDTGCNDSFISKKVADELVRRNVIGPYPEDDRPYIIINGSSMQAQGRIELEFQINAQRELQINTTRYRCVFLVVPENRSYDFLLGKKFLFENFEWLILVLMDLRGPTVILDRVRQVAQAYSA